MPLGACLQGLGCFQASGHSQGNGNHVVVRAIGRGTMSGVVGSKLDTCSVVEQFPRLSSPSISSEGCCLTLGATPLCQRWRTCAPITGDQWEGAATLLAGF